MAYLLGELSDAEKDHVVTFVRAEAEAASSSAYRHFLQEFPEAMLGTTS